MAEETTVYIRDFLEDRILSLRSEMERQGAIATGKTENSLRMEFGTDSGQLYGAGAFDLNSEGQPYIDFGTPPNTLVEINKLQEWANAVGYKGNVRRLQTRIFERGSTMYRINQPRTILSTAIDTESLDRLKNGISKVNLQKIKSEIIEDLQ